MSILKFIVRFLLIWITGIIVCAVVLIVESEINPIPSSLDGAIPDSLSIPLAGFSVLFLVFLIFFYVAKFFWNKIKNIRS